MDSLWIPRNITPIDGSCYVVIDLSISQEIFSYLKMFSMQWRKSIRVYVNQKRISIAMLYNYMIYAYVICDENDSK